MVYYYYCCCCYAIKGKVVSLLQYYVFINQWSAGTTDVVERITQVIYLIIINHNDGNSTFSERPAFELATVRAVPSASEFFS